MFYDLIDQTAFFFFNRTFLKKNQKHVGFVNAPQSSGYTLQPDREVDLHLSLCCLCQPLLISRCQEAECTFGPSSLSSTASPELCCEGLRLAGTICGEENNQEKKN